LSAGDSPFGDSSAAPLAARPGGESGGAGGGEFALIARHFRDLAPGGGESGVLLGIGDDCALLDPSPGHSLAMSSDSLVAGRHFAIDSDAEGVGHKALAVNLSDLAAMGARPRWVSLSLTLPEIDEAWLAGFCRGFAALAARCGVALVGGDTTRGATLVIAVTVLGECRRGQALRRAGASPGDAIYVSGTAGDAALALRLLQSGEAPPEALLQRLERPEPRLELGRALRGVASACIDTSDGLAADLGHICAASGVGARIDARTLPLSAAVAAHSDGQRLALHGGDDYELCFCVPAEREMMLGLTLAAEVPPCTRIGSICAEPGLWLADGQGAATPLAAAGFDHFSGD